MAVRSMHGIKPKIWIPPIYTTNVKLTIERHDGTIDDITDIIESYEIEDTVTEGIGIFTIRLPNPNETYTGIYTGMEIFRYYKDYASSATTLRFRGRVEKPSAHENYLTITGRSEALFVMDEKVTHKAEIVDIGQIIYDIFNNYGQGRFDLTDINTSTGITLSVDWRERNFWDCVEEVCINIGYDCFINSGLVVKLFLQGSITNTTDGIVHDYNLIGVSDFAPDLQFVRNKIRVLGATIDGVQVMYTANDSVSQTAYGIRRENISDDSIVDFQDAKDLGEYTKTIRKDPPIVGEIKGVMLATVQPGEKIRLSSPLEGLNPGTYRVIKYQDTYGDDGLYTIVTINKEPKKISHIFKDRIQRESRSQGATHNPHDLDHSIIELFDENSGINSGTVISEGKLKPTGASGTWISKTFNTPDDNNMNQFVIDGTGDNTPGAAVHISFDEGITYQLATLKYLDVASASQGNRIKFKIIFNNASQNFDSIQIQFITSA